MNATGGMHLHAAWAAVLERQISGASRGHTIHPFGSRSLETEGEASPNPQIACEQNAQQTAILMASAGMAGACTSAEMAHHRCVP